MTHLLVTNDFPPKHGGIQSYLWELWRRLPPEGTVVLTTPHAGSEAFDRAQPFRIVRSRQPVLLPHPGTLRAIRRLAAEVDASLVVLDPAVPLGLLAPWLDLPYALVLHGAEVTVPGRLPIVRSRMAGVLRGASLVVAAGGYPAAEAERIAGRPLPTVVVPPGVDVDRFVPLAADERRATRHRLGLPVDGPLVLGLSRLVPRKGFDVLLAAAAQLAPHHPGLHVAIAGAGRDGARLERVAARHRAPVTFLGRVPDADMPSVHACADVFAMVCRNRWAGLEQEGFGIVFLEAAAAGVPQVAGSSGGAAEAVDDGTTGLVVREVRKVEAVAEALDELLRDPHRRSELGRAARRRAEAAFTYDLLAERLHEALRLGRPPTVA